jgi:hypothetical protein
MTSYYCYYCRCSISSNIYYYSIDRYNIPLCIEDQHKHSLNISQNNIHALAKATPEAKALYIELLKCQVPAILELWDGYKSPDITIHKELVHIEIDGSQHRMDFSQAISDLERTVHSLRNGYITLRIPNILIYSNLGKTTGLVIDFLNARELQLKQNHK